MPYSSAQDSLASLTASASTPARGALSVTPSDTVDLSPYAKALKANASGVIYVLPVDNYRQGNLSPIKLVVSQGEYIPLQVARVFATNTTVTDIVALYQ